jgi:hypothetical protein
MFEVAKEDYGEISACLNDILLLLENLKSITINGKEFKLEYFFSSDYKMLRNIYGHKGSNAKEGCFWCKKNLKEIPKIEEDLQITRTLNDNYEIDGHQQPLIKFIEYKNCVVDLLHLLLRVTDHLIELLVAKLIKIDNNSGGNIEKRPYFKIFMEFLKNECKISNAWYVSSKSENKIKLRSLNGNERIKVFKTIFKKYMGYNNKTGERVLMLKNFSDIFPKVNEKKKKFDEESNLWFEFYRCFKLVKEYNTIDLDQLNKDLKEWLTTYIKILWENLKKKTIPPYIHVWTYHMCEILEIYGSINKFTTQSLEKLNDFTTQYYHLCSNKNNKKKSFLKQIVKKRNRIEFYNLGGLSNEFYRIKPRKERRRYYYDDSISDDEDDDDDKSNHDTSSQNESSSDETLSENGLSSDDKTSNEESSTDN